MKLPIFLTQSRDLMLMQTKWKSILDILLGNPSLQTSILSDVPLINGTTTINHLLGQSLTGWRIIGINAAATIYDKQASNQTPNLTLILTSNAACVVTLEVF